MRSPPLTPRTRAARAAVALCCAVVMGPPAGALAAGPTTRAATRAVARAVHEQYDLNRVRATCRRAATRRWRCRWTAHNVLERPGCRGSAEARWYGHGWNVTVRRSSRSRLC